MRHDLHSSLPSSSNCSYSSFFFNDTATTEIYTLSLHDALPIYPRRADGSPGPGASVAPVLPRRRDNRSEEHTSELQSRLHLVCRLLLEKKKKRETGALSNGTEQGRCGQASGCTDHSGCRRVFDI